MHKDYQYRITIKSSHQDHNIITNLTNISKRLYNYYIIKKYVKTLNVKAIATLEEMQGKQYNSVPSKINND